MKISRFFYLVYYVKGLHRSQFRKFLNYSSEACGKSKIRLLFDSVFSVFRYNTSLTDYFHFGFYELTDKERNAWAGTGFMYEFQLKMNPLEARKVLEDKIAFNERYNYFIKREYVTISTLVKDPMMMNTLIGNGSEKIVLKNSLGQAGKEVRIISSKDLTPEKLIRVMNSEKYDLAEEYVVQHPVLMNLSSTGLNTVRIITQITENGIEILAARLRISVNCQVDNLAAGNVAAPVDTLTGRVTGNAVYSDITKEDVREHPVTGVEIPGFQIPYWQEILDLVTNAASLAAMNKSVGWDIAIAPSGPLLIEGNHNWCKLLWQLPVRKGLKEDLEKYF